MRQIISNSNQIGEIVRGRRKSRGISQRGLAERLGISQSRLSSLESRPEDITIERFIALANLLGLEIVVRDKAATPSSSGEW